MGLEPLKGTLDGVLVVDKPSGITSHDVVAAARRLLGERRIGHTGTLDPIATGVLPLACGRATRLVRFLSGADKDYLATILLGLTTDSFDVTGRETGRSSVLPSREAVASGIASLIGERLQTPPAYSAKHVAGRRAYELARREQAPALAPVAVRLERADLVHMDGARVIVDLRCSSGFYVRTFAHELGALVGSGAALEALRRTRSGDFDLAHALTLDRLESAAPALLPLGQLLPSFPRVTVTAEGRQRVAHGRTLDPAHCAPPDWDTAAGWVRVLDDRSDLVALARPAGATLHPEVVLI